MKRFLVFFLGAVGLAAAVRAAPSVTVDRVQQRYPWNGMVDVDYTISGIGSDEDPMDYVVALNVTGTSFAHLATNFENVAWCDLPSGNGQHRITWDSASDGVSVLADGFTFTVTLTKTVVPESEAQYMIVDMSGGSTAATYPVRYVATTDMPTSQFNLPRYKRDCLLFKRIPVDTVTPFTMGGEGNNVPAESQPAHSVRLTKDYFLALYPMTARQHYQVQGGTAPSDVSEFEDEPENIPALRPQDVAWPDWSSVQSAANSVVSNLVKRAKKGTASVEGFRLPTEAEWECACRAGTTTKWFWGDDSTIAYKYAWSSTWSNGHKHEVGSLLPNAWNFYDMCGNGFELCMDWYVGAGDYTNDTAYVEGGITVDPQGAPTGEYYHANRGGAQSPYNAYHMTSYYRNGYLQSHIGAYRLARVVATKAGEGTVVRGTGISASLSNVSLDTRTTAVRLISQKAEVKNFAYNSSTNGWPTGGDAESTATVRMWKMSATDRTDPTTWTELTCEDILASSGEGVVYGTPVRRGFYKAQHLVDGALTETGYLDLSETTDLPGSESIAEATLTLPCQTMPFTGKAVTMSGFVVTLKGSTLTENTDYVVTYRNNLELGTATAVATGIGNYENSCEATFQIVPAAVQSVDGDNRDGAVDTLTNAYVTIGSKPTSRPFVYNTSEECLSFMASEWSIGGLATNATITSAVARVSIAPMATAESLPDETRRKTLCVAEGEGMVRLGCAAKGFYEVKMEVLTNGVERSGALTRVLYVEHGPGIVILVR